MSREGRAVSEGFFCLFVSVCVLVSCEAGTLSVNAGGSGGYPTIQAAIDHAADGDVIVLQPGLYRGAGNRDIDFLGKAVTVRSVNPADPAVVGATTIDCQGTEAEPHRGFVFHRNEGSHSILSGVTVINGYGGPFEVSYEGMPVILMGGGAVLCFQSSPVLEKCLRSEERRVGKECR